MGWIAATSAGLAALGLLTQIHGRARQAKAVWIEDPASYWANSGFAEMVPPIRLPTSRSGDDHITVWLRVPDSRPIRAEHTADRVKLVYPVGTAVDRVEMREPASEDSDHAWRVSDVRGMRLDDGGKEHFHSLQRDAVAPGSLAGFEWTRGDVEQERSATDGLERILRTGILRGVRSDERELRIRRLRALNACQNCHEHDRAERTSANDAGPRRATDSAGLYTILTVLDDSAPLEIHRPRDLNVDDPFVTVSCPTGDARLTGREFVCPNGGVPRARLDLAAALAAGDPHVTAVCRSRRYLYAHMDDGARAVFAAPFSACAIGQ